MNLNMNVVKRDGRKELISFDKVINRIQNLCNKSPSLNNINIIKISQQVVTQIVDNIKTTQLDELSAQICSSNVSNHLDYGILASRIIISNNQKNTTDCFSSCIDLLYRNISDSNEQVPLISTDIFDIVMNNKEKLNNSIDYERDFLIDYFGFKTLENSYLFKINNKVAERIQHMFMRVSIGIHGNDINNIIKTYDYMSQKYFIHATPTLFHSGTDNPQLLSCFLLGMEDSVDGMYKCIGDCAKISKWAGGIGLHLHDIRSKNSIIRSTNGKSNGIMPLLKVLNDTARHINQSGRRNGSFAIYLEAWHPDILVFLEAKKNHGDENARARDLFYGIWVNDIFMRRVQNDEEWSLFCPDKCKNLTNSYGKEFEKYYTEYEKDETLVIKKIKARKLWEQIIISEIETGTPYILYKDSCNSKSNQQNLGTIRSSNLCTEIIEYSSSEEYACCTLASIGLPKFVLPYDMSDVNNVVVYSKKDCKLCEYSKNYLASNNIPYIEKAFSKKTMEELEDLLDGDLESYPQLFYQSKTNNNFKHIGGFNELLTFFRPTFNFKELYNVAKVITLNLNKIIDNNFYPVVETRYSNKLHRPLGIGVQGLASVYSMMNISFDNPEASLLNKQIFATIYYASLEASMELARDRKKDMIRIKVLRNNYGPFEKDFVSAKITKNGDLTEWWRGSYNSIDFSNFKYTQELHEAIQIALSPSNVLVECTPDTDSIKKELIDLHNKLLPIDEELFNIKDSQYAGSYSSFEGSPLSKGKFQFDLWEKEPLSEVPGLILDWKNLRKNIIENGVRNSLLLAPMPTASTSQILGNNECIEPITSNIYTRGTLAGSFTLVNKQLLKLLNDIGLWDDDLKQNIILQNGSIKDIQKIPQIIRDIFKTSWDLSQKVLINQAADRGIYVCQSQSMNLWIENPTINKISSMHMYSWKKGLKTGIYYLRTKSVSQAQKFTVEPTQSNNNPEICESCSA